MIKYKIAANSIWELGMNMKKDIMSKKEKKIVKVAMLRVKTRL